MKIYKPNLMFHLDVGFFRLQTHLFVQAIDRYTYDYIRLEWKLFKWSGGFNLYKPDYSTQPTAIKKRGSDE